MSAVLTLAVTNSPTDLFNAEALWMFFKVVGTVGLVWTFVCVLFACIGFSDGGEKYCPSGARHDLAEAAEPWEHHCLYDVCGCTFEVCVACDYRKHTRGGTLNFETLGYAVREKEPPKRGRKGWERRPGRFATVAEAEEFRGTLAHPDLFEVVVSERPSERLRRRTDTAVDTAVSQGK